MYRKLSFTLVSFSSREAAQWTKTTTKKPTYRCTLKGQKKHRKNKLESWSRTLRGFFLKHLAWDHPNSKKGGKPVKGYVFTGVHKGWQNLSTLGVWTVLGWTWVKRRVQRGRKVFFIAGNCKGEGRIGSCAKGLTLGGRLNKRSNKFSVKNFELKTNQGISHGRKGQLCGIEG